MLSFSCNFTKFSKKFNILLIFAKQNVFEVGNFREKKWRGFFNLFLREPISAFTLEEGSSPPPRRPKIGPSGKRRRGTIERRQAATKEEEEDGGEESGQGPRSGAVSPGDNQQGEEEREDLFQDETSSR
jgi:hypothetical protein